MGVQEEEKKKEQGEVEGEEGFQWVGGALVAVVVAVAVAAIRRIYYFA